MIRPDRYLYPYEEDDRMDFPAIRVFFGVLFGVMVIILYFITSTGEKDRVKGCIAGCEADKATSIYGIVIKTGHYASRSDYNAIYFYQPRYVETTMYYSWWYPAAETILQPGDSVAKDTGLLQFRIFRQGIELDPVKASDTSCTERCR